MSLVAIVGRPNVGKSTLFNRIVGHRSAIVDDMPGVTRDRNYASAEWAGRRFTLVDTGGYIPLSEDVIETAIREQAQVAIEEADLVLFVVDAHVGPTPGDAEIAGILRKASKKVRLVVNKVDSAGRESAVAEFFSLGLGDPLAISALAGRNIGDMLQEVTSGMDGSGQGGPEDPRLKIAILGRPNVGKSSLVNALIGEDRHIVTDIPGTTRDPIDSVVRYHGEELLLIDTAGLRRRSRVSESVEFYSAVRTLKAVERCDVAVILLDVEQALEHQDLRIIEAVIERKRPALLAANKWDLVDKDAGTAAAFEKALRARLRKYDYLPIMFISARGRQRVFKVLEAVKTLDAEQRKRIATAELNAAMGEDIAAFPPRSKSGKEIKIKYVTQVNIAPPVFAFFCNEPDLVEEAYRRYLENRIRARYAFTGVPIVIAFKRK